MSDYPRHVPADERPERTLENIPDDVVSNALTIATRYGECPECNERQFYTVMPGYNTTHECTECGLEMRVVG